MDITKPDLTFARPEGEVVYSISERGKLTEYGLGAMSDDGHTLFPIA